MQRAKTAITTPQIAGGLSEYCVGGLLKAGYILRHQLRSPAAKPFLRLRVIRGDPVEQEKACRDREAPQEEGQAESKSVGCQVGFTPGAGVP
jgi:hypothetical protein